MAAKQRKPARTLDTRRGFLVRWLALLQTLCKKVTAFYSP